MFNMWWISGNIYVPELEIAPTADNENDNHGFVSRRRLIIVILLILFCYLILVGHKSSVIFSQILMTLEKQIQFSIDKKFTIA